MDWNVKSNVMKERGISNWCLFGLCAAVAIMLASCDREKPSGAKAPPPRIVIGYQTAWATAGQLMETLVHTSIPKLYGSSATFRTFLFGPDMNEAAVGGNIDGTTTGVVPTVNLMAVSDDWVGVCRLIDFPCTMVARTGTGITNFAGLKGRKVGVPFGSGAHPYIVQRLRENNLPIGTGPDSVDLVNVSPAESATALQQGSVDAIATWEPNATIVERKGFGKPFDDKRYIGLLTVRKSLVEQHPDEVVALIKSMMEANFYVAQHREQTDEWFAKRSNFDRELLKKIRVIEPNLKATRIEEVSVQITTEDMKLCQEVADQMFASGLIKRQVKIADHVNVALERRASEELLKAGAKAASVLVSETK